MKSSTRRILVLLAVLLASCRGQDPNEAAGLATVQANVAAMQREDLAGVMATVHTTSPLFETTRTLAQGLFDSFDLRYTLSDLRVLEVRGDEMRVAFTQRTERVAGAAPFRNNTITGVHLLRREDGRWKIYDTPSVQITQMDLLPNP